MKLVAKLNFVWCGVSLILSFAYATSGNLPMSVLGFLGAVFNWYVGDLNSRINNKEKDDAESTGE